MEEQRRACLVFSSCVSQSVDFSEDYGLQDAVTINLILMMVVIIITVVVVIVLFLLLIMVTVVTTIIKSRWKL